MDAGRFHYPPGVYNDWSNSKCTGLPKKQTQVLSIQTSEMRSTNEIMNPERFLLSAKFPEVGSCGHTDVDSPDVFFGPKGSSASHSVRIAINENEADTVHDIVLTEPLNSVPQCSFRLRLSSLRSLQPYV